MLGNRLGNLPFLENFRKFYQLEIQRISSLSNRTHYSGKEVLKDAN